ncbi:MAG TPA: cache domain-containing protein, partial [Bacillota bacterium]|nr:cache domain-containing protein [Bacillota bacterium]
MPFFARVRVRLMALVLIAVLPALGLIFYTAYEQRRLGIEAASQEVQRLIRLAAQRQNELIEGARQLLVTLSHHQEIIELEPNHCEQLLTELLSIHQVYANFGIALPDGRVIISAVPLTNEVHIDDRSYFKDAIERRTVAVGDYQIGRITGKPGLNIGCPILDFDGKVQAVIYASLDLSWFPRFVKHVDLPPGSSLTLSDRNRTTLARYPDPEGKFVGQIIGPTNRATPPLLRTNLPPQRDRVL